MGRKEIESVFIVEKYLPEMGGEGGINETAEEGLITINKIHNDEIRY